MDTDKSPSLEEIKKNFLLLLDNILSFNEEPKKDIIKALHEKGSLDSKIFNYLHQIIKHAETLKKEFTYIRFENSDQLSHIRDCLEATEISGIFENELKLNERASYYFFSLLFLRVTIYDTKEVKSTSIDQDLQVPVESALKGFVETAEIIRKYNYEGTIASGLEKILSGDKKIIEKLINGFNSESYDLSKSFIALAAPSLEGKTQFAFVLKHVKPLYFALGARDRTIESDNTQPIYLNFKDLNIAIEECAREDIETIRRNTRVDLDQRIDELCQTEVHYIDASTLCRVTTDELTRYQQNLKLFTLGLLVSLVDDAKTNYDRLDPNMQPAWLEYHAKRGGFRFRHYSIAEIPKKFFEGFCIFLDEFKSDPWAVYIRNLARSIGLKCAVANTNSSITNLVGKLGSGLSGSKGENIWSIVVTELKMGNFQSLDARTHVGESIAWICENAISDQYSDDRELCRKFLTDFKENQVKNLRPGVALAAADVINDFRRRSQESNIQVTFESFFSHLVFGVRLAIKERKPKIVSLIPAQSANLNLMLSAAYDRYKTVESLSSLVNFLEYHFYYLVNPSNPQKWLFLTLAPVEKKMPPTLRYFSEMNLKPLEWSAELTFFKSEDYLTTLSCMNLFSDGKSFAKTLEDSYALMGALNYDTGSVTNPLSNKRDGNRLEVLSTLCCSHSSHHVPIKNINSYTGQTGTCFLKNLFTDLFVNLKNRLTISVDFTFQTELFSTFNLQDCLDRILIPYLWISNMKLPKIFKNMMNESKLETRSFNMATINRTADQTKIDIEFPLYCPVLDPDTHATYHSLVKCNVECKNWSNNVLYGDLIEIIERAQAEKKPALTKEQQSQTEEQETRASLSIIICNKLGSASDETKEKFDTFCTGKKINAYRFKLISDPVNVTDRVFQAILINSKVSKLPLTVALVIELAGINPVL